MYACMRAVTLLLAFGIGAPASAQVSAYRLGDASTHQDGCLDPCDCILWPESPLRGTFHLTLELVSQFQVTYSVTDVRFEAPAPPPADPPTRIFTGSGVYTRIRPLIGFPSHSLSLDLSVNGGAPRTFASLPALDPFEFPRINLAIADNEFVCYNIVLDLHAAPVCPCDLTGDGGADLADLLVYLGLWFAHDPRAEFDGRAGIEVFDLLAYLDCWFAGCG